MLHFFRELFPVVVVELLLWLKLMPAADAGKGVVPYLRPAYGTVFHAMTSAAFLPALAFWIMASAAPRSRSVATISPVDFLHTV